MSHVIVLGGGWVGSAIAAEAARHGDVTVIDPPLDPQLSARDAAATRRLAEIVISSGADAVVNACGRVSGSPPELRDANVDFVRWLCESLAPCDVRLVHVGSASEYGDPGTSTPVDEACTVLPTGDYATTKAEGTEVVRRSRQDGLDAVTARVFNLVGPSIPAVSPLRQWTDELLALGPDGGEVEVWWPDTTRDFIELSDGARALLGLAAAGTVPPVVNVCSGVGLRFGDIVAALARRLGVPATIRSLERPGIPTVVGDPSLLSEVLGWSPSMSLDRLAAAAAPTAAAG
ncbi:MAG: NAD-dependent epimerase/dehydratase family protein [Microthrixaceae bacterium]